MPHGESWLSFFPGYGRLADGLHHLGQGIINQDPIHAQHIAAILLVVLVMTALALVARGQLRRAGDDILPDARLSSRTIVELLMEGLLSIMQFAMSREAALRHFWLIGTLGFFILFSNLLGLIPGFLPPTENFNTTFACASMVFVYYNFYAFRKLGIGHLAHMANPTGDKAGWILAPLLLLIELISHSIRPISLSVRLLANISADHLVLAVFIGIFPFLLPVPFLGLGLFVALIQTLVFVLLSSVYLGEVEDIIAHHVHAQEHAHPDAHDVAAGASGPPQAEHVLS